MRHSGSAPRHIFIIRPMLELISITTRWSVISSSYTSLFKPGAWCGRNRMDFFVLCLATVRSVDCHRLISNAHIVSPFVIAVVIFITKQ